MSWFLIHKQGMSLVSGEGIEEKFFGSGAIGVAIMLDNAGKLVINMQAERPPMAVTTPAPTPPKRLTRSAACDSLVKIWEGYHRALPDGSCEAYPDVAHGWNVGTIGFGTTRYAVVAGRFGRAEVRQGDTLTRDEALQELDAELDKCEADLAHAITAPVTQAMFDALISFAYNLGTAGAQLQIDRVNRGNYEECARSFDLYVKAAGMVLPGLINRRNDEEALFRSQGLDPGGAAPAPAPTPAADGVARVTLARHNEHYASGHWRNLAVVKVQVGKELFRCVSGLAGVQVFRMMGEGVPGSGEPVEQGTYDVSDIIWKGGKDNYKVFWSEGLGAWVIDMFPRSPTRRSAIEFHCDLNRSNSPGTMGCIGVAEEDQVRFIAAWRAVDPTSVVVDWGL